MARDFYQELGVSRDASGEDVRKAYRKLAAKLHPDRNPGDAKTEEHFKAVNRAYHVLSDPKQRRLYDEFGEDALREGFNPEAARAYRRRAGGLGGGVNLDDLFGGGQAPGGIGDLFGDLFGARSSRRRAPRKGSEVHSEVTVDFTSAIRGATLTLSIQDGTKDVKVRVPPGAADGDKVRVPGHGGSGNFGGPHGDLVLTIRVRSHPYFDREGLDLYLDLPITAAESYRGAKVEVPTPTGDVLLSVPKHAQSGQVARLRGKGVARGDRVGDLYVRFLVRLPETESDDLRQAIDVLTEATDPDVRGAIRF